MKKETNCISSISHLHSVCRNCLCLSCRDNMCISFIGIPQKDSVFEEMSKLRNLIYYDYLTQLPNRRFLHLALHNILEKCHSTHKMAALLFIDLDNFKELNDAFGHAIGDLLLQKFSARLSTMIRFEDLIVRYSGDEFIIVLDGFNHNIHQTKKDVECITRKILNSLIQPFDLESSLYYCSISIGITIFGCHPISMEEIIHTSDLAMYSAKIAGKNTYHIHDKIH